MPSFCPGPNTYRHSITICGKSGWSFPSRWGLVAETLVKNLKPWSVVGRALTVWKHQGLHIRKSHKRNGNKEKCDFSVFKSQIGFCCMLNFKKCKYYFKLKIAAFLSFSLFIPSELLPYYRQWLMDPFSYALGCSAGTNNPENFYYSIWFLTRLNVSLCVHTENSSWFCVVTWREGVCVHVCKRT